MIVFPACGGKYELLEGRFFAPLYGGQYSANEQCDFHIQTFPGSQIMVAFSKFNLEQQWSASCVDYVEVYTYIHVQLLGRGMYKVEWNGG